MDSYLVVNNPVKVLNDEMMYWRMVAVQRRMNPLSKKSHYGIHRKIIL